ncbi:MAG: hypothetical protein ACOYMC_06310 [Pirellulales bacterium]|jgi:hypothetical protein
MVQPARRRRQAGLSSGGVSGSTSVEFFSAGERADHRASFVQATLEAKAWFDTFARPAEKAEKQPR